MVSFVHLPDVLRDAHTFGKTLCVGVSVKVFQEGVSDWTSRRGRDGPHQHGQFSKSPENLKRRKVGRRIPFFFMRWDIHLLDLDIHPTCP